MSERLWTAQRACQKWRVPTEFKPEVFSHFLADDAHRVIACAVPKAGCTSFKEMMCRHNTLNKAVGDIIPHMHTLAVLHSCGLYKLSEYNASEIDWRLKEYTKVALVRHPLDRLLSAFNEKFIHGVYARGFRDDIYSTFSKEEVRVQNRTPQITFEQFLTMIRGGKCMNRHWAPSFNWCYPCNIEYDHIVKLETIHSDLKQILPLFRNPDQADSTVDIYTQRNAYRDPKNRLNSAADIFRSLDPDLVKSINEVYRVDLEVFGYSWDNVTGIGCRSGAGKACCWRCAFITDRTVFFIMLKFSLK